MQMFRVTGRRWPALGLSSLLGLIGGCGSEGEEGDEGLVAYAVSRARECGVVGEGEVNFRRYFLVPDDPDPEVYACAESCWMEVTCDGLRLWMCEPAGSFSQLELCLFECTRDLDDTFECGNGALIARTQVCDADEDCSDGSDEADCEGVDFFECADGGKAAPDARCDGIPECDDRSDEADCPAGTTHDCNDGSMLPAAFVCDLYEDCDDASDEQDCAPLQCTEEPQ